MIMIKKIKNLSGFLVLFLKYTLLSMEIFN